jgi:TraK protein
MRCAIVFALLLFFPAILHSRVIAWDGKSISVSISTERLTRIEFAEALRSAFLSRTDIAVEKEDRSLYIRALVPEIEDTLFVVGESGTAYELNLSTSDNSDQTVVISHVPKSLQAQAESAGKVPALDLMRSMMRGLAVDGYEIIKADKNEVYRDAFFSMKLIEAYKSPVLDGYVLEVENLAAFPVLSRVQEIDYPGIVAIAAGDEFLQPRPKKASEAVQEKFRTRLYIVAVPTTAFIKE